MLCRILRIRNLQLLQGHLLVDLGEVPPHDGRNHDLGQLGLEVNKFPDLPLGSGRVRPEHRGYVHHHVVVGLHDRVREAELVVVRAGQQQVALVELKSDFFFAEF